MTQNINSGTVRLNLSLTLRKQEMPKGNDLEFRVPTTLFAGSGGWRTLWGCVEGDDAL